MASADRDSWVGEVLFHLSHGIPFRFCCHMNSWYDTFHSHTFPRKLQQSANLPKARGVETGVVAAAGSTAAPWQSRSCHITCMGCRPPWEQADMRCFNATYQLMGTSMTLTRLDGNDWESSKNLADVIVKPLSMIFEWSWGSREVPADWKLANIVPVFKMGKKDDWQCQSHCSACKGDEEDYSEMCWKTPERQTIE